MILVECTIYDSQLLYKFGQAAYAKLDNCQIPILPPTKPNAVVMAANTSKERGSL